MTGGLRVDGAGVAVVTDLGRSRGPAVGLPVNGALDQYSARVANILVANSEGDPIIEVTAFDFAFTAESDLLIAVTGAPMTLLVDGIERSMWEPVSVGAGQQIALYEMAAGLRTYVAVHSSFDVPVLLDSCAPDTVAGFGVILTAGTNLAVREVGPSIVNPYFDMSLFNLDVMIPYVGGEAVIDVTDGPDADQFEGTRSRLFHAPYVVTAKSNHIGLRMTGQLPVRTSTDEVVSRGVPVGAVEVPPGDELLVLHRGRGVTAGYPVLAVVTPLALDALGQVRPGQHIRFRHTTVERADENVRAWRAHLDRLRQRINTIYACLGIQSLVEPGQLGSVDNRSEPTLEGIT
ncbi:5-oxoprolinase subunit C family protein [Cryobacterium tepidiphilum]|uniref:Biotin-dependent carboxyltransferase n=1 Tax=Cryobacterium tepidiphilum TaxID=2486026 RepID=A0A3M8LPA0_9MICO|nr:biotin-dependent carboxyltransferase family protein [Cryobacterium tepidiphilum]RNE67313.1 biotin-dependent carboxyltransferase [Cryobacterium tepidiphilum]